MTLVTQQQFQAFAPRCTAPAGWATALDAACQKYSIDTPNRVAYFMATLYEETGGFTVFVENLDYSPAELLRVWPSRFDASSALAYARQPQRIANYVYANRDGNGNEASGDGWAYRGRGPMQVTFRDGYAQAAKATGLDLVGDPDLMLTPNAGAISAASFWAQNGCNAPADRQDMPGVTRIVNGGETNLSNRLAALARWQSTLAASPAPSVPIPAPVPPAPVEVPAAPSPAPASVAQVVQPAAPVPDFTAWENAFHVFIAAVIPIFGSLWVLLVRWERARQATRAASPPAQTEGNWIKW